MLRAAVLLSLVAVLAAGCGDDGSSSAVWDGPPRPLPEDGSLPTEAFDAYLADVDQPWETSAGGVATAYALPLVGDAGSVQTRTAPEGSSPVTVTIGGLLDDSVESVRLTFALTADGERWTVSEARWAQRCRPGRGHRDFSPAACT